MRLLPLEPFVTAWNVPLMYSSSGRKIHIKGLSSKRVALNPRKPLKLFTLCERLRVECTPGADTLHYMVPCFSALSLYLLWKRKTQLSFILLWDWFAFPYHTHLVYVFHLCILIDKLLLPVVEIPVIILVNLTKGSVVTLSTDWQHVSIWPATICCNCHSEPEGGCKAVLHFKHSQSCLLNQDTLWLTFTSFSQQ